MGIGRREFLKLFGTSLAALALSSTPAIALIDDYYINRKFGIAFRKPSGWHFGSIKQMGELKAGQLLDLEDKDLARRLIEVTDLPILTIIEGPISALSNQYRIGANIFLNNFITDDRSCEWGLWDDPYAATENDQQTCQKILRDFRVLSPTEVKMVSECRAVEYVSSFIFEHVNLQSPVRVRMRSMLIVQNPAMYTLRMYDSPYLDSKYVFDYSEFVDSIRIL